MKFFLFVCVVASVSAASTRSHWIEAEWRHFKARHNKVYETPSVDVLRKEIYMQNSHMIARHNIRHARGEVSYRLKMNQFGDMLHHEFVAAMNGLRRSNRTYVGSTFIEPDSLELPRSIDWREKGAVTPVKNQGHCGSCWSFSTTGALEGQMFRKTGKLVALSEQNLIDCSGHYGNDGCDGGFMDSAFQYIKQNRGIDSEESYPYEAVQGMCRYSTSGRSGEDTGFIDIPAGDEVALTKALATVGPVSVGIDASHESFQFYHDGVYSPPECDSNNIDHGVLAVGYGTNENGLDYYIVKNSWGPTWGKDGYIMMARNANNKCGIASTASYPLV